MIVHLLKYLLIRLPMLLLGIFILPFICAKYRMGDFPVLFKHFDDYRGRYLTTVSKLDRQVTCRKLFGLGHCELYQDYNKSAYKRYVWTAFRNSTNVLVHSTLARKIAASSSTLQIFANGHMRTLENKGRTKAERPLWTAK